ncbi:protein of unknown function [Micropruina glycogenica]|uniref:Uncharacterized protein n=1 Tax=Micropruina glycogenica TaxID=75385 RepID=A0A2N9JE26_9ACTN|nr:protein of unknown function [Micropruina glycogenica]
MHQPSHWTTTRAVGPRPGAVDAVRAGHSLGTALPSFAMSVIRRSTSARRGALRRAPMSLWFQPGRACTKA